jgi:hypothetical protein
MSVELHQQQLGECYNGSQDPNIQQVAQEANQYTEMLKAGQITNEEFIQLMEDLKSTAIINKNMDNMRVLEHLNTAINGLINLAKLLG